MKKEFIAPKIKVTSLETLNILASSEGPSNSKVRFGIHSLTTENADGSYGF